MENKTIQALKINDDVRYSSEHTWARMEEELVAVGISDYAQDQLGEIIYIELPQAGDSFEQGQAFGFVESAKTDHHKSAGRASKCQRLYSASAVKEHE